MSLTSVIQDWCDTLDPSVFEQIFADGTEKCLGLFRTITTDEDMFIARLAKATIGLRLEDWDDSTRKDSQSRFLQDADMYESISEQLSTISQQDDHISDIEDQIATISAQLDGDDVREQVKKLNAQIKSCDANDKFLHVLQRCSL